MNQTFTYQGYMSNEATQFFGKYLIQEQRDGLAVVGFWAKLANGNTQMLEKGLSFTKNKKGIHLINNT